MAKKKVSLYIQARDRVKATLQSIEKRLKRFGAKVKRIASVFVVGFTAATAALIAAAKKAEELNIQVAKIAAIAGKSIGQTKKMVRELSAEFGMAKEEVTEGLYKALSIGVPQDNVMEYLRKAAPLARAGTASLAEAAEMASDVMKQFSIPIEESADVMSKLFTVVQKGDTTLGDMAGSFSNVAQIASASNVSLDEVLAGLTTMTKMGVGTSEAITQIRSALISTNKVLGDGWSKTMTMQDAFALLNEKAGGSSNALKDMLGRVEAVNGVLALTGATSKMAAQDLDTIRNSSGNLENAWDKIKDVNPLQKMQMALGNVITLIGDAALGGLASLIDKITVSANKLGDALQAWTDKGGVIRLRATLEGMWENIKHGVNMTVLRISLFGSVMRDAVSTVVQAVEGVGAAFGHLWVALGQALKGDFQGAMIALADIGQVEIGLVTAETEDALADIEAAEKKHAKKLKQIQEEQLKAHKQHNAEKVKIAQKAADKISDAEKERLQKIDKLRAKEADLARDVLSEVDKEKQASLNKEISDLKAAQNKRKELAKRTVSSVQAEYKARQKAAKQLIDDEEKAKKIRDKMKRGIKVGQDKLDFLAAYDFIQKAKNNLKPGQEAIDEAQRQLDEMQKNGMTLKEMKTELIKTRELLSELTTRQ